MDASFCPAVSGCRKAALSNGQPALDFDGGSWQAPSIAVTVPPNKTLVVVSSRCSDVQERENVSGVKGCGLEGICFIAA